MYADADAVESHDHCTCVATPVFRDSDIQGYNPDEYKAMWREAQLANRDDLPEDLQERIERKWETDAEFNMTKENLMVMRYQQGIS